MNQNSCPAHHVFCGQVWHIAQATQGGPASAPVLEVFSPGALAVTGEGRVAAAGPRDQILTRYPGAQRTDFGDALILPGFIDTHLHFPQLDVIGSHGAQLLDWLERYTFPAEQAFADPAVAARGAARLVDELLANGTTCGAIYSTVHATATDALFEELLARGLRAVAGKVSMDRNAPPGLTQDAAQDLRDTQALIERWHGREGRLFYALTPRFAPNCTPALMEGLGELYRSRPGLYLQTHWAEQKAELEWVARLFPELPDYLAVYERFGLLGPRTLLGHAIHVSGAMIERMRAAGAVAVHCPTSNLFLGSGLFPLDDYRRAGARVGLATDIGAGTSLSMWRTMAAAYEIQQLRGHSVSPEQLLAWATVDNAAALGLDDQIGNFAPGRWADFQVLDPGAHRLLAERFARTDDPAARLFALVTLADDRLTRHVHIAGRPVWNA